jgi:transposase
LWERIHPVILEMGPPKATGRKRADPRRILDGVIFRMRTGCHWNRIPRELGDGSATHRTFQRGGVGPTGAHLGGVGGGMRGTGRCGLGVAGH